MPQNIINNLGQIVGTGEVTKDEIVLRFKTHTPTPSKGGKLLEIASTSGFKSPGLTYEGKPISLNFWAGVKPAVAA